MPKIPPKEEQPDGLGDPEPVVSQAEQTAPAPPPGAAALPAVVFSARGTYTPPPKPDDVEAP